MHAFKNTAVRFLLYFLLAPHALTLFYLIIPAPSTLMLAGWLSGEKVERNWVPLKEISPSLIAATLTAEDSAFCDHFGMDFQQLQKSLEKAQAHDTPIRATSTITQQTAKNLFLWHGRSWLRKILEVPLTFWLELTLPKKRILALYLNIAQWGDGIYGADAAARHYFGVSARALSASQSALLAAALPNPLERNPAHPSGYYASYAAQLLYRLQKNGPDTSCVR